MLYDVQSLHGYGTAIYVNNMILGLVVQRQRKFILNVAFLYGSIPTTSLLCIICGLFSLYTRIQSH